MKKTKVAPKIDKLSRLLAMTANPTRLRIFCMMYREKNACVGEIADEIGMSVASISHHLQLLKQHGLFVSDRQGNHVCYRIVENDFTRQLQKLICLD